MWQSQVENEHRDLHNKCPLAILNGLSLRAFVKFELGSRLSSHLYVPNVRFLTCDCHMFYLESSAHIFKAYGLVSAGGMNMLWKVQTQATMTLLMKWNPMKYREDTHAPTTKGFYSTHSFEAVYRGYTYLVAKASESKMHEVMSSHFV